MDGKPLISAIICTYNRAALVQKALASLSAQTLGPDAFEVILIDDGSTDETRANVEKFSGLLNIHYAYQTNSGLASGKNHGLFLAKASLVAFLDDDDILDSRCLEEHLFAHQRFPHERFAVLGYTDLAWEPRQSPLMRYVTEIGCQLFSYPHLQEGAILDYTYFWGGRSSCKRAFLLEHGVFNPVFRFGAEDIELGYRLRRAGLQVIYHPGAISHMIRTLDFDGFCRRCHLQGRSNWVFSRLHPDPEVSTWAQIEGIEQEWNEIEPRFDEIMRSGRALDRLAQEHARLGRTLDDIGVRLLHRGYAAAFRANRIKGSVERLKEDKARQIEVAIAVSNPSPSPVGTRYSSTTASTPLTHSSSKVMSKNEKYDLETFEIMRRVLQPSSNCIDVGCHTGQMLEPILQYAPLGKHYAFEPIPSMYQNLIARFSHISNVSFSDVALSNVAGESSFKHVVTNPGYSGLRERKYAKPNERIEDIRVRTERLDAIIPASIEIDFIKIDVEGGEQLVLEGGIETIKRCKPYIVFEHGRGAAEYYGTTPQAIYHILAEQCGLNLALLDEFLETQGLKSLDLNHFIEQFERGLNYYFVAYPHNS